MEKKTQFEADSLTNYYPITVLVSPSLIDCHNVGNVDPVIHSVRLVRTLHPGSIPPMPQAATVAATMPAPMSLISIGVFLFQQEGLTTLFSDISATVLR